MNIGILECGHTMPEIAEEHGDFPEMFARLLDGYGFTFRAFDVENMVFPDTIRDCDGWLLTGSKHGAYDELPFIAPLEDFIRNAYAASVPLVGICFGHQLIAQALGGQVEKFEGGWALGLTEYQFENGDSLKLNAWHQDQILDLPQDATVLASNAFCKHAALVYGDKAYSIQPHPEFQGAIISRYTKIRRGTLDYPDAGMDHAVRQAHLPDDNAAIAAQIAGFFKQPRELRHD
ncbi:MAG: type 1 glutamine amidotransferase [Pseudomonadota bacterium]